MPLLKKQPRPQHGPARVNKAFGLTYSRPEIKTDRLQRINDRIRYPVRVIDNALFLEFEHAILLDN